MYLEWKGPRQELFLGGMPEADLKALNERLEAAAQEGPLDLKGVYSAVRDVRSASREAVDSSDEAWAMAVEDLELAMDSLDGELHHLRLEADNYRLEEVVAVVPLEDCDKDAVQAMLEADEPQPKLRLLEIDDGLDPYDTVEVVQPRNLFTVVEFEEKTTIYTQGLGNIAVAALFTKLPHPEAANWEDST